MLLRPRLLLAVSGLLTAGSFLACGSSVVVIECKGDQVACDGSCTDTSTDPSHCGECGVECDEACVGGVCTISGSCPLGQTDCFGACVDTQTDAQHCGGCNILCIDGPCVGGTCTVDSCAAGLTDCQGSCVDTSSHPQHCGGCGNLCPEGSTCSQSQCVDVPDCPPGLTPCGASCVDTDFDQNHCGGCFSPCSANEFCNFGSCQQACNDECGACGVVDLGAMVPIDVAGDSTGLPDVFFPGCAFGSAGEAVFRFTAPDAGSYVFDTQGSTFDTVLSLVSPSACFEISCSDNFGPSATSRVTLGLAGGEQVLVLVDGNDGGGFFNLSIDEAAPPMCPTQALGSTLPVLITGSTVGGQDQYTPSCAPSTAPEHSFTFTAPTTKTYDINTAGSSFDTMLTVIDGSCVGGELGCNDDAIGLSSQLLVPLVAGQVVTIVVDGFDAGAGSYQLHID